MKAIKKIIFPIALSFSFLSGCGETIEGQELIDLDLANRMASNDTPKEEYPSITAAFEKLSISEKFSILRKVGAISEELNGSDLQTRSILEKSDIDISEKLKEYSISMGVFLPTASDDILNPLMENILNEVPSSRSKWGCSIVKNYPNRAYYYGFGSGYKMEGVGRAGNGNDFFCDYELQFGRKVSKLYAYTWAAHYLLSSYNHGDIIASQNNHNVLLGHNRTRAFMGTFTKTALKFGIYAK